MMFTFYISKGYYRESGTLLDTCVWRSSNTGASVSVELGTPDTWMYLLTWKLLEPHTLGIFFEASSSRHDQSLVQSLGPLPSLKKGRVGLKVPGFCYGLVLVLSLSPGSSHYNKGYSYHLGNSKAFRNCVSGARVKDQILE